MGAPYARPVIVQFLYRGGAFLGQCLRTFQPPLRGVELRLALTDECLRSFDSNFKMSPPLRSRKDVETCIAGLADGTIDALVSDHTPVGADEKNLPFAEATPAPRPPKKSEEKLRVQYTDAELLEIGKKLAETAREKEALEDEKKSIMKGYGSRLDGLAAKISELSNNLSSGFNHRDVTVETTYGDPGPGKKTTRRLDTGAVLRVEAMTLADRIVIFDKGRIQQVGAPHQVYERPANLFVASFIGSPAMNFQSSSSQPPEANLCPKCKVTITNY